MKSFELDDYETVWYFGYYFRYGDGNSDYLSHQIMDFKANHVDQVSAFSRLAGELFADEGIQFDYVMRILSSKETTATQANQVRHIAIAITKATGAQYIPMTVKKNRETRSLKGMGLAGRRQELDGVYEINSPIDLDGKSVLVVDDVTTTGTSFEAIARTLKEAYPDVLLYGFALVKTHGYGDGGIVGNDQEAVDKYNATLAAVKAKKK